MIVNGQERKTYDGASLGSREELRRFVSDFVATAPVVDMHTHLYPRAFGDMSLSGIDELLTYHYLVAELFRSSDISVDDFWRLSKQQQADLIWRTLFVENSPISEATRGVITILGSLGLDTNAENLNEARDFFGSVDISDHLDHTLKLAGVSDVVMTNDPFDIEEAEVWTSGKHTDARFHAALRLDRLLNSWPDAFEKMVRLGYSVDQNMSGGSITEIRHFLDKWIEIMKPLYMAVSLPDDFQFPSGDLRNRIISEVVLPIARENDLPLALMIGVRRGV
ncbi:MAG: glucuronate isomerase, partial [Acidobacteriota bacterium]